MTLCGRGEKSNVWVNRGDSGVLCKGNVTGLPCPLGCPAAMWAGRGANKRLFSGDTAVDVWRPRLGPQTVGGKNGPFVPKPQSFKLQVLFQNTDLDGELWDEPHARPGQSALLFSVSAYLSLSFSKANLKSGHRRQGSKNVAAPCLSLPFVLLLLE